MRHFQNLMRHFNRFGDGEYIVRCGMSVSGHPFAMNCNDDSIAFISRLELVADALSLYAIHANHKSRFTDYLRIGEGVRGSDEFSEFCQAIDAFDAERELFAFTKATAKGNGGRL